MNKIRFTLKACAFLVVIFACSSVANAQATRTWVSGVGDDVNPCSRTAPCKTWAGAISKTAAGGEIDALDPGGFGTLTITKSIIVDGTTGSGFGSTLNSSGISGFTINDGATGTPNTSKVTLRNLSINGAGTTLGTNGIRFIAGAELHVQNVTIDNQSNHGIDFAPGARGELFVTNCRITRVTGAASAGIRLTQTTGNVAVARIEGLIVDRVANGVLAQVGSRVMITNSHFSINGVAGINVDSATGNAEVSLKSVSVSFATIGLRSNGTTTSIIRVSDSTITGNGTGMSAIATAQIISYTSNETSGNTAPGAFTSSILRN